jgi:hypothetical protein
VVELAPQVEFPALHAAQQSYSEAAVVLEVRKEQLPQLQAELALEQSAPVEVRVEQAVQVLLRLADPVEVAQVATVHQAVLAEPALEEAALLLLEAVAEVVGAEVARPA